MADKMQEIMTGDRACLPNTATLIQVAKLMREHAIGEVLVLGQRAVVGGHAIDKDPQSALSAISAAAPLSRCAHRTLPGIRVAGHGEDNRRDVLDASGIAAERA